MPPRRLYLKVSGDPVKNGGATNCCAKPRILAETTSKRGSKSSPCKEGTKTLESTLG